jgi:AcrR family transcriptional regulator
MMTNKSDIEGAVKTRIKNPELVQKKHRLIAAKATKLFIKKGFPNTTMRDISGATKITLGNLYSYIKKKEDILCLVFDLFHQSWAKDLERNGIMDMEDPQEQIRMAVRAMLLSSQYCQDEIKLLYRESRFLPKKFLKIAMEKDGQLILAFEKMIVRGVERGIFQVEDPFYAANMIVFQMSLSPLRGWNLKKKYAYDEIVRLTENYILKAIIRP